MEEDSHESGINMLKTLVDMKRIENMLEKQKKAKSLRSLNFHDGGIHFEPRENSGQFPTFTREQQKQWTDKVGKHTKHFFEVSFQQIFKSPWL